MKPVWQHEHKMEENRILRRNLKDVMSPPSLLLKYLKIERQLIRQCVENRQYTV